MPISVKICGLRTAETLAAAIGHGAAMVGFVFYPGSPRFILPREAGRLCQAVPEPIKRVGLVVDEKDESIEDILKACNLDILQLHGSEDGERCRQIKDRFGLPIIKAIKIGGKEDLRSIEGFSSVADYLLFDAKPSPHHKNALPGGNALSFDWSLLRGLSVRRPWLLSGGLTVQNLARAVAETGADAIDVSSGVEDRPGVKNVKKIVDFLAAAHAIN